MMKRYALWDHNRQRFVMGPPYETKQEAEIILEEFRKLQPKRKLYVVEWEIQNDD
jgi:hypothetical protein